ncbi:serine/threonine-protein kinase [Fervidibacter sacchari]|uniref:Serine/threonine protein kinase n=1 Tax=Candidatus Fervidibacter sacchari TaxID=1448929 RepID=A0ABT2EW94_9BACT|nr:serine/threonine-protein kinase [Candidatus Fervidibacter sacchari]MCS3921193.1 serine/threonine protein kinase [Candidatus Fervidibacter sacchari]WKU16440.1 serine/threonine-protein kinase [Candidatus Fervidibacter sacchari]
MVQGSAARPMQMCPKCSQNNTLTARSCIHCGSPLPSIPLLAKNTVLNNRYTVLQVLGFGGFSAVYLAFDQRLSNRKVAVKELLHTDPAIVQQFETEAKLLATLSHPALPKAFDWFKQFGTDRYYLVMEFIDGVSAWEMVNRSGPMTPHSALRLMEPVFDAVAYLHRQNPPVLHRDIKPQNILVSRDRKVYLVDFGIAKVGGAGQKTATGARGVTPGFSPPEQYLATGETDVRSDIYSLGATMYFLLTGKVPPDATERLQREMAGQPSLEPIRSVNTAVSQQVEQAIMMAMALRKEQRFNSVEEFLAGLKGQTMLIQPPAPVPAPQPPMPQPSQQQPMPQPPVQPPVMQPTSVSQPAQPPAPAPMQPSPAQMTPPPVVGGAREWCPACKAYFYIADPSQQFVNCPNCGQLIHRAIGVPHPLYHPQQITSTLYPLQVLLANKRTLIRIGAVVAIISLTILPLVSCGEMQVTGLDILEGGRTEFRILLAISILSCIVALFLRNPAHCLISTVIGLVSFVALALWVRYGPTEVPLELRGEARQWAEESARIARTMIHYRFGSFSAIAGFALAIWAAYQWLREEMSIWRRVSH